MNVGSHRKASDRPHGSERSPATCDWDARRRGAAWRSDEAHCREQASVRSERWGHSLEQFTTARRGLRIFSRNLASLIETQNQFERIDYEDPRTTHHWGGCDCFRNLVAGGAGADRATGAHRNPGACWKLGVPEGFRRRNAELCLPAFGLGLRLEIP